MQPSPGVKPPAPRSLSEQGALHLVPAQLSRALSAGTPPQMKAWLFAGGAKCSAAPSTLFPPQRQKQALRCVCRQPHRQASAALPCCEDQPRQPRVAQLARAASPRCTSHPSLASSTAGMHRTRRGSRVALNHLARAFDAPALAEWTRAAVRPPASPQRLPKLAVSCFGAPCIIL